jgi:hypothetical protein
VNLLQMNHAINDLASDELIRGLCKMLSIKDIPVWLAFVTTVFLDIHHALKMQEFGVALQTPRTLQCILLSPTML